MGDPTKVTRHLLDKLQTLLYGLTNGLFCSVRVLVRKFGSVTIVYSYRLCVARLLFIVKYVFSIQIIVHIDIDIY